MWLVPDHAAARTPTAAAALRAPRPADSAASKASRPPCRPRAASATRPPRRLREIHQALAAMQPAQTLNVATRAVHAAAFWDRPVRLASRSCARMSAATTRSTSWSAPSSTAGLDPAKGFVVLTSRVSVEMVQKTAMLGAEIIVAGFGPDRARASRRRGSRHHAGRHRAAGRLRDFHPSRSHRAFRAARRRHPPRGSRHRSTLPLTRWSAWPTTSASSSRSQGEERAIGHLGSHQDVLGTAHEEADLRAPGRRRRGLDPLTPEGAAEAQDRRCRAMFAAAEAQALRWPRWRQVGPDLVLRRQGQSGPASQRRRTSVHPRCKRLQRVASK